MDRIAIKEKKKYDALWSFFPDYREVSPADILTPAFLDFFKSQIKKDDHIIDFGCGTGHSAKFLLEAGLKVQLVDFCDNCLDPEIFLLSVGSNPRVNFYQECLWSLSFDLTPSEWIICFDVLEHLPLKKIDAALKNMAFRMKKGGLVSISLIDDLHGSIIEERLHMTVKPASWWRQRISCYFSIQELATTEKNLVWAVSTGST